MPERELRNVTSPKDSHKRLSTPNAIVANDKEAGFTRTTKDLEQVQSDISDEALESVSGGKYLVGFGSGLS